MPNPISRAIDVLGQQGQTPYRHIFILRLSIFSLNTRNVQPSCRFQNMRLLDHAPAGRWCSRCTWAKWVGSSRKSFSCAFCLPIMAGICLRRWPMMSVWIFAARTRFTNSFTCRHNTRLESGTTGADCLTQETEIRNICRHLPLLCKAGESHHVRHEKVGSRVRYEYFSTDE